MFRAITWFLTLALHYFLYFWNRHFCRHNSLLAYITSVILGFSKSAQRTWILVTPIHWIKDVFVRGDVVGGFRTWRNAFCFCFPASWHNSFFSLKTAKSCTSCQTKVFVSPFEFFEFWEKKVFSLYFTFCFGKIIIGCSSRVLIVRVACLSEILVNSKFMSTMSSMTSGQDISFHRLVQINRRSRWISVRYQP